MDGRPSCIGPGIAEIVASARWKRALFTTYALSLSYLESELLSVLVRSGCDDIWVIADAHGYRGSLLERRAARVGLEYRLVPAALEHGVLHAKCIYLAGEEGDLLLVGSGNLTFGGHGRNLEVFEVLQPAVDGSAFGDFASFLEVLATRPDILLPRIDWAEDFAELARVAAAGAPRSDDTIVRLLHSVEKPIVEQLGEIVHAHGECTRALVQSPYHDPDGAGVQRLVELTGSPRCGVAVPAQGHESPFPFAKAAAWPQSITSVKLTPADGRFGHAKYYEFDLTRGRLIFTGSVNATLKALATTDNVEIGVLRILSGAETLPSWSAVSVPAFKAQKRMPAGLGKNELVFAGFDRTDLECLRGTLMSLQPVAGSWDLVLIDAGGGSFEAVVAVAADGKFEIRAPQLAGFSETPAVQLLLRRDGREARGWVHNEMALAMGSRRHLTGPAIFRLMRQEAGDDDVRALLDYLAVYGQEHFRLFSRPVAAASASASAATAGTQDKAVSIALAELAPGDETRGPHGPRHGPRSADDPFERAMSKLRLCLLGHDRERGTRQGPAPDGDLAGEGIEGRDGGGKPPDPPEIQAQRLGLVDFEMRMGEMIDDAADRPAVRDGLLVMLLEVNIAMRLHHLRDVEGSAEFLGRWFRKACRLSRAEPPAKTALAQHVVTSAVILAAREPDEALRTAMAAEVHDHLEKFYGGSVDRAHAIDVTIEDLDVGFFAALAPGTRGAMPSKMLAVLLSVPTRRQQLESVILGVETGRAVPDDLPIFRTPLGAKLLDALRRPRPERRVQRAPPGFSACAFDNYTFSCDQAAAFARERIGRCVHCDRFTLDIAP